MGMTIENSIRLLEDYLEWQKLHKMDGTGIDEATRNLIDVARKYQMMQADYNARLKADMVAALKELQLEIKEIETGGDAWELAIKDDCNAVIQKKIDALEYDLERGNDGNNVRQTD